MTMDRRFSSLKGKSRKWLDSEDFDPDSELDRNEQVTAQGAQSVVVYGPLDPTGPQAKPLARLGDVVHLS